MIPTPSAAARRARGAPPSKEMSAMIVRSSLLALCCVLVAPVSMFSEQSAGSDAAATLRKNFDEVSGWIAKAAELVPADKYTYRPAPSVRTFGQLIAHVADGYNFYCGRAAGRKIEWSDAVEKGSTDKATLAQKLKQSADACKAVYGGTGQVGALIDNVGHTNLHYGNIITYVRMLGLVPPSS
jgi:uncharacterized damage-inducible protein DinB